MKFSKFVKLTIKSEIKTLTFIVVVMVLVIVLAIYKPSTQSIIVATSSPFLFTGAFLLGCYVQYRNINWDAVRQGRCVYDWSEDDEESESETSI